MRIFICTFLAYTQTSELDVEPTDTIETIAEKIEEKYGIPVTGQRLIFGGKMLSRSGTLSDYGIQEDNSLHVILRGSYLAALREKVPVETAFPTGQEAFERLGEWKLLADAGNFDADTHIVDPFAHYEALDSLEQMTVTTSTLYRQSGVYRLRSSPELFSLPHLISTFPCAPPWIADLELEVQRDFDAETTEVLLGLFETNLIIYSVINSFERLQSRGFCTSFFSILVERCDGAVAEIVKIHKEVLVQLQDSLQVALTLAHGGVVDFETIMDCIAPAVQEFLNVLSSEQLKTDVLVVDTLAEILNLYRMVACMLDLGIVSYVGSHAARFDTEFFQRELNPFRFEFENDLSFDCSLRPLACLEGFLDARLVWVFRAGVNLPPVPIQDKNKKQTKILILTTIDGLADIWGSVWAEAKEKVEGNESVRVKKYHVSKGVIRRVREDARPLIQGAVKCHWYSWIQDYRRRFSTLLTRTDELTMAVDDKLLIGSNIRVNSSCKYTLQEYEMNYSDMISPLGPLPSAWKLDSAIIGLQLSAPTAAAFQIQGGVKKIPETTLKQHIWTKWSLQPVLDYYVGVEVSHCTGNAMRVPLKRMLLMDPMQELLELQIPKWSNTEWGMSFQKALAKESNEAIFQFWNDHQADRPLVGQLVRCALDVLDSTGKTDSSFRAAFLHQNRELAVDLDLDNNEWAGLLQDSRLMATYALVNNRYLECRQPDHTASICGDEFRYTVLQPNIEVKRQAGTSNVHLTRLKIEPHSQTYKRVDGQETIRGIPLLMTPESSINRVMRLNFRLTVGKELLFPALSFPTPYMPRDVQKNHKVIIRASGRSFGGMSYKRNRIVLEDLERGEPIDVRNVQESREALEEEFTQSEIAVITAGDLNGGQEMGGSMHFATT